MDKRRSFARGRNRRLLRMTSKERVSGPPSAVILREAAFADRRTY
jgi:hypothetical protein